MTIESAKAFLEKVQNDEDLRTKLSDKNLSGEDRLNIAKAEGFQFSAEEMRNVRGELSEDDMANVVGAGCSEDTFECRGCHGGRMEA